MVAGCRKLLSLNRGVVGHLGSSCYYFFALSSCLQPPNTPVIAPARFHRLTTTRKPNLVKRKVSRGHTQAPRDSTTQKCPESLYAEFLMTGEASLLSTKRTPPTPCCRHYSERCSRASLPSPPSPPQKRRALSLNPPTRSKQLRRSTLQLAA